MSINIFLTIVYFLFILLKKEINSDKQFGKTNKCHKSKMVTKIMNLYFRLINFTWLVNWLYFAYHHTRKYCTCTGLLPSLVACEQVGMFIVPSLL